MKLIIRNQNSSDELSYANGLVVVPAYGTLEVPSSHWFALYTDVNFVRDLRLNNFTLNDGDKDVLPENAEKHMRQLNEFNYNNKDTDGAMIVRPKAAKKGWSFWAVPVEITTSTIGGALFCQTSDGTNLPWVSCKIYNSENIEITVPGVLDANLGTCVKTVIDFEPTFDFEIIGGALRVNSNPLQDVRLWIVAAPDIPAAFGGSKEFASGINLKFLAPDSSFEIDGRVSKFVIYDPLTHQGKIRIILKHPAGLQLNTQIIIHMYRQ